MKQRSTNYDAGNAAAVRLVLGDMETFPEGSLGRRWAALWQQRHGGHEQDARQLELFATDGGEAEAA